MGQASAQGPDLKANPTYGSVNLKAGFLPDPFVKTLVAGGSVRTEIGGVTAQISQRPDFTLTYVAGAHSLRINVESAVDTTLLVNLPNGTWVANDDGGEGKNPQLSFAKPLSGQYRIWVGAFGSTAKTAKATLYISERQATPSGMGLRVDVDALGKRTNLFNSPRLFYELAEEWNGRRDKINTELENLVGSLNKYAPKGFTFVRQKSTVGAAVVTTNLGKSTGGFTTTQIIEIGVEIKNSSMRTRITQPTPLGSDADPEFLLTYDLRGKVFIPVASDGKRLAVSKAVFESSNVKIDPRNTTAKLVTWFDRAFFDSHYKKSLEDLLVKKVDLAPYVNELLQPVNAKLATVPGQVTTRVEPGFNILLTPRLPEKGDEIIVR